MHGSMNVKNSLYLHIPSPIKNFQCLTCGGNFLAASVLRTLTQKPSFSILNRILPAVNADRLRYQLNLIQFIRKLNDVRSA